YISFHDPLWCPACVSATISTSARRDVRIWQTSRIPLLVLHHVEEAEFVVPSSGGTTSAIHHWIGLHPTVVGCEGVHMVRRVLRAEWLFRRGQKLAAQERFDAAIEAFAQAQSLRSRAVGIALHRALALAEMSRLPEAVLALQQAMAVQPANPV